MIFTYNQNDSSTKLWYNISEFVLQLFKLTQHFHYYNSRHIMYFGYGSFFTSWTKIKPGGTSQKLMGTCAWLDMNFGFGCPKNNPILKAVEMCGGFRIHISVRPVIKEPQFIGFTLGCPSLVSLVFAERLVSQVSLVSCLSLFYQVCTIYSVPTVYTASLVRGPSTLGVPGVPPIPSGLKMNGQVWVAGRKVYERPIWIRIVGVRRQREKSFPLECFITRK